MTSRPNPIGQVRACCGTVIVALALAIATSCSGPRGVLASAGTTAPAASPTPAAASAVGSTSAPGALAPGAPSSGSVTVPVPVPATRSSELPASEPEVSAAQLPTEGPGVGPAVTSVVTGADPTPDGTQAATSPTPVVRRTAKLGGLERTWLVVAPPVSETSRPRPLVLLLHGLAADGKVLQGALGFDPLADGTNVVLAYPDAIDGAWNDERAGVTSSRAHQEHVDDAAFLDTVIDDAVARNHVDRNRVAVVGFSNGGMMAAYYACSHSDRVRAIAVVAGAGGAGLNTRCNPARPVSVLAIHSRRDPVVPFLGGPIAADSGDWGSSAPLPMMLDRWRSIAGCQGIVDRVVSTGSPVVTEQHAYGCRPGIEIVLERVDSKVHGWLSDPTFMTTDIVWQFVVEHTLVPA